MVGVGGDESKRRVSLEVVADWAADDRMQPNVVGHADGVETHGLGGLDNLGEKRPQSCRAARPVGLGDVECELHVPGLKTMSQTATRSTASTRT